MSKYSLEVIKNLLEFKDARAMYTVEAVRDAGLPEDVIAELHQVIESDFSQPETVCYDSSCKPINQIAGIMGISIASHLVRVTKADASRAADFTGMQVRARICRDAVRKAVGLDDFEM